MANCIGVHDVPLPGFLRAYSEWDVGYVMSQLHQGVLPFVWPWMLLTTLETVVLCYLHLHLGWDSRVFELSSSFPWGMFTGMVSFGLAFIQNRALNNYRTAFMNLDKVSRTATLLLQAACSDIAAPLSSTAGTLDISKTSVTAEKRVAAIHLERLLVLQLQALATDMKYLSEAHFSQCCADFDQVYNTTLKTEVAKNQWPMQISSTTYRCVAPAVRHHIKEMLAAQVIDSNCYDRLLDFLTVMDTGTSAMVLTYTSRVPFAQTQILWYLVLFMVLSLPFPFVPAVDWFAVPSSMFVTLAYVGFYYSALVLRLPFGFHNNELRTAAAKGATDVIDVRAKGFYADLQMQTVLSLYGFRHLVDKYAAMQKTGQAWCYSKYTHWVLPHRPHSSAAQGAAMRQQTSRHSRPGSGESFI